MVITIQILISSILLFFTLGQVTALIGLNGDDNTGATCQCNCCHLCPVSNQQTLPVFNASVNDNLSKDESTNKLTGGQIQPPAKRRRNKKKRPSAGKISVVDNATTTTISVFSAQSSSLEPTSTTRNLEAKSTSTTAFVGEITATTVSTVSSNSTSEIPTTPEPTTTTSATTTTRAVVVVVANANRTSSAIDKTGQSSTDYIPIDKSSMSDSFTDDLIRLICSYSPDWLVKTKLSDSRFMAAIQKQKLKVRYYRPIFGIMASNEKQSSTSDIISSITNPTSSFKAPVQLALPNLFLRLTNKTTFITAVGSSVFYQPLNEVPSSRIAGTTEPSSLTDQRIAITNTSRTYLIFGNGSSNATHSKLASSFVVWPTQKNSFSQTSTHPDRLRSGSQQIVEAYEAFKLNGAAVCSSLKTFQLNGPFGKISTTTPTLAPSTDANSTAGTAHHRKRARSRKQKKKGPENGENQS